MNQDKKSFAHRGAVQMRETLMEAGESFLFRLFIFCLGISIAAAWVYSVVEDVSFFDAFFVSLISIMTEYGEEPATWTGKIAVYIVMLTGLILLAFLIGEVSKRFLESFLTRGRVKTKKRYLGSDHFLILGNNSKVPGIVKELRSPDLEKSSYRPIVILSPDAHSLHIEDLEDHKDIHGVVGDPLVPGDLEKAGVERAHRILLLSDEAGREKQYSDTRTVLLFNTLRRRLDNWKGEKHVVVEFFNHDVNLLPFGGDTVDRPEVYIAPLQSGGRLVVEPVYMEKMPTYLFIQSMFVKEVNEVVQKLLATHFRDTNEFYYMEPLDILEGKSFYTVEDALLDSNCIPLGYLREEDGNVKLVLNPNSSETYLLRRGDRLVVVAYGERDVEEAMNILQKGSFQQRSFSRQDWPKNKRKAPFNRLVILNWNHEQFRDMVVEMENMLGPYRMERMKIVVASPTPDNTRASAEKILRDLEKRKKTVDGFDLEVVEVSEPMTLEDMKNLGVCSSSIRDTRAIALYDNREDGDMRNLHKALLIENRIDERIFTAVEVYDSKNYHHFVNTRIDVVVSINQISEKLLAQALLKPYISIIFRNLLTFSEDTNEFYLRDVPSAFIGKPVKELRKALIGHPVIFLAVVRPRGRRAVVTINPRWRSKRAYTNTHERIYLEDSLQKGDKAMFIAYDPDCVDGVLSRLS